VTLPRRLRNTTRTIRTATRAAANLTTAGGADRGTQILLALQYASLAEGGKFPSLQSVEFRNYSQNGEDGILLFLFSVAGMGFKRAVEICAGNGIECNTANLILHHGWDALLVDGDAAEITRGQNFYARHPETFRIGPTLIRDWVTAEDINTLLAGHGFNTDLDLLSLDLDGMDYWILNAISSLPRVIVCEYNNCIPAGESVTVPYNAQFTAEAGEFLGDGYFGASLDAFVKLLNARGYRLVGANRHHTNAFFLREDVAESIHEVPASDWLNSPWARHRQKTIWPLLRNRDWVRV
jgi:hypothetical protein